MTSETAVIIDSSCSLPAGLINKYDIQQVPLHINIDGKHFVDPCEKQKTLALFGSGRLSKKHHIETEPPSPEDFERQIMHAIEAGKKSIVIQTVNRKQGDTYQNANIAAANIRNKLGLLAKDVVIRVMDSRTVFAGQGLMATETIRRILHGENPNAVRRSMDSLSSKIHTYVLPKSPLLAQERASKRNEKAVSWTQVLIANTLGIHPILCIANDSSYLAAKPIGFNKSAKQLFAHTMKNIEHGLLSPVLAVNYGGPLEHLHDIPGYTDMEDFAKEHGVKILKSVMSIAGGIYTSVGSISIAYASDAPQNWRG